MASNFAGLLRTARTSSTRLIHNAAKTAPKSAHSGHNWACLFFAQQRQSETSQSRRYSTKVRNYSMPARQEVAEDWESNIRQGGDYLVGPRDDSWWTGPKPTAGVPGVGSDGLVRSIASPNLATCTREDLKAFFDNTWLITEVLFAGLQTEVPFFKPPYHHLRHPLIFYYGHPATLYINKLRVAGLLTSPINPYYENIFETGVDEMKWDDMSKNDMIWPSVEEVADYRREVYNTVVDVIMTHPDFATLPDLQESPFWSIVLGCDHERIHIETSSVLFRELPIDTVRRPEWWAPDGPYNYSSSVPLRDPVRGEDYPENDMVAVSSGDVTLGKPTDFPSFGWDNEYGHKDMRVKSFKASKYLVSNGEYYEFVKSGGYATEKYWSEQGWSWRTFRNIRHPTFWVQDGPAGFHQYKLRNIFDVIDMPWSWPADVNFHEAQAFANWKGEQTGTAGMRITTEAEHNRLRDASNTDLSLGASRDPAMIADGEQMRDTHHRNINLAFGSETPVNHFPANENGVHDAQGNVWNWCEDHLSALPGFRIHPVYEDFSIPCFDGEHHVIMGGSFASTGDEASNFARFHFRPHFFQHAGFRVVEPNSEDPTLVTSCMDNQGPYVGSNPFRCSRASDTAAAIHGEQEVLQQYLHLHFGGDNYPAYVDKSLLNFPSRAAQLLAKLHSGSTDRALDIGCAVGGSTFELARHFNDVIGLDISEAFIGAAKEMQSSGQLNYKIRQEGEVFLDAVATRPDYAGTVSFDQADATCIAPDIGQFDAVLIANVIDRITTPKSVLGRLGGDFGLVKPGGTLVITSPFAWKESFTPKELWIGGRENAESMDELSAYMASNWELIHKEEMPLVIQEAGRTYELHYPLATVWRHKQ